jgi:hypothetical protein
VVIKSGYYPLIESFDIPFNRNLLEGADFGKIPGYRRGGTFNSSCELLSVTAKGEFHAPIDDLMGNP